MRNLASISLAFLLVGLALPVSASHIVVVDRICLEEFIEIPEIVWERDPFPVGCEIIDCCPGCPGPWPIDWLIQVESIGQGRPSLVFDNLDRAQIDKLSLEGEARWSPEGELMLDGQEVWIRGFSPRPDTRLPVALPKLRLDPAFLEELQARAVKDDLGGKRALSQFKITVEQYREQFLVNRGYWKLYVIPCLKRSMQDQITLTNNLSSDSAVVFLDARRSSGCVDDEKLRVTTTTAVGNILSNGPCNSETIVLSDDNAVELTENVSDWTDSTGDLHTVDLESRWPANVAVWIAMPQAQRAGTLTQAQNEMAQADGLYNTNHCGIEFLQNVNYTTITNQATIDTINDAAQDVWDSGFCTQVGDISGSGSFTAGQLNVYYVNSAFTGWYCPGSNVIAIGTNAQPESLTHEFGHAFSLGHTNNQDFDLDGTNDFGNVNIMWGGGAGRTTFSEPQCYRTNINTNSTLNTNGERTSGPTRNCPDAMISTTCPWLGDDVAPN